MYNNRFTRRYPGLILLLIDQSESMNDCLLNGTSLNVIAAELINHIITDLILQMTGINNNDEEFVKRTAFVCVIGYGGKGDGTDNQFDYEAEIITDGWIDELAELPITKSALNQFDMVQVVTPVHGGGTPMASAFGAAKNLVEAWIQTYNTANDPAPVIINITDGEPTDSITDLKETVNAIKALSVPDGAPLIFNIHLTAKDNVTPLTYPSDINECSDAASKLLFELSSEAHADLISTIPEFHAKGLQGGEKLFMSNVGQPAALIDFLRIGIEPFFRSNIIHKLH